MIATILPNASGGFPGVMYNEKKVHLGKATLLEMSGFGTLGQTDVPTTKEITQYLEDYSDQNFRIQKPQFHLAISCKGNEMTNQQLLDFAHAYLKKMGYGDPNQPILIYAHHDTDNNHLHIVTSRVSPDGRKINDHNERRKSQKVIDKLLGHNANLQAEKDIKTALDFNFRSETQFKAVLEAMNYECYEKDGRIMVKKGGMVQGSVSKEELAPYITNNENNPITPNFNQLKAIFSKYRDVNSDIQGLKSDLRRIFGIELVFFGKKDSPYGYVAVDFHNKVVIEGAKIMNVKQLTDFSTPEEHFEKIDSFIDQCFRINPNITTKQLNRRLNRLKAYVKKDQIIFGTRKKPLKDFVAQSLDINNKIAWLKSFNPRSQEEINFLARIYKLDNREITRIKVNPNTPLSKSTLQFISDLRNLSDPYARFNHLKNSGYRIICHDGHIFAYNPQKHIILDLDRLKIKVSPQQSKGQIRQNTAISIPNLKNLLASEGSSGDNREWEVGTKKGWDEDSGKQISY